MKSKDAAKKGGGEGGRKGGAKGGAKGSAKGGAKGSPRRSAKGGAQRADRIEVRVLLRRGHVPLQDLARTLPAERQHLDHDELTARAAPTEAAVKAVEAFARKHGLTVEESSRERALVRLSGARSRVAQIFGARAAGRADKVGGGRDAAPAVSIPAELQGVVDWVLGPNERVTPERLHAFTAGARPEHHRAAPLALEAAPSPPETITYSALEIARAYDFPPGDGEGQCIGIIELTGGYRQSDMEKYFAEVDPAGPRPVPQITCINPNQLADGISNMEVTMDVQIIGALCPRAKIVVYNANLPDTADFFAGYYDILSRAIHDSENRPSVISVSWSFPEFPDEPSQEDVDRFNRLLEEAALLGITVCSSVGDSGAVKLRPPDGDHPKAPAAVFSVTSFAASSPYVLGCGGTTLLARDGVVEREVVWNRLAEQMWISGAPVGPGASCPMATGGGVSHLNPLPSYQSDARVPPRRGAEWMAGRLKPLPPFAGRGVPDVAANADLSTGWAFVFEGAWVVGGGTSAAAPLWASLITLINQGLDRASPGRRVGWLNPLLYHLRLKDGRDVVRPITEGNNGGYEARPDLAWNPCTGLGVPWGKALADALGARFDAQAQP